MAEKQSLSFRGQPVVTVGELTRHLKQMLEGGFPAVSVRGEIVNFKVHQASGHAYFSLKESRAVINCAIWKPSLRAILPLPRDGEEVVVHGSLSVYEARGSYSLIVRNLMPFGLGQLILQREFLRKKLVAEGLFDRSNKQKLPRFPRTIGVVTSGSGAAIGDITRVLSQRFPLVRVIHYPAAVEGVRAVREIVTGIQYFNLSLSPPDVLIVGRGGGSAESLWTFNEEDVVRAIAASSVPVISAVGHEQDFTLADEAADLRAATPSNAAELAVPDQRALRREVQSIGAALSKKLRQAIVLHGHGLATYRHRVQMGKMSRGLVEKAARLSQRFESLSDRASSFLRREQQNLFRLRERARAQSPRAWLSNQERIMQAAAQRVTLRIANRLQASSFQVEQLRQEMRHWPQKIDRVRHEIEMLAARIAAVSPAKILAQGYTITTDSSGNVIQDPGRLVAGDAICVRWQDHGVYATVSGSGKGLFEEVSDGKE